MPLRLQEDVRAISLSGKKAESWSLSDEQSESDLRFGTPEGLVTVSLPYCVWEVN